MRRVAMLVAITLAAGVLSGCAGTDRPEGVVERWLIALNQGAAGRPAVYAADVLSQRILPGWASKDPGQLDVIEVGKGKVFSPVDLPRLILNGVPYRVVRTDGATIEGTAILSKWKGDWQVVALRGPLFGLEVPSQGGQRIGSASGTLWLGAFGAAALLSVVAVGLMAAFGRHQPLPTDATALRSS